MSVQRNMLRKSRKHHTDVELYSFVSRKIGKDEVVGYYYGPLFYVKLTKKQHRTKTYKQGVMQVTAESFRKWTSELAERMIDKDGIQHSMWIVPATYREKRYLSDARYVRRYTNLRVERLYKPRESKVQFL